MAALALSRVLVNAPETSLLFQKLLELDCISQTLPALWRRHKEYADNVLQNTDQVTYRYHSPNMCNFY